MEYFVDMVVDKKTTCIGKWVPTQSYFVYDLVQVDYTLVFLHDIPCYSYYEEVVILLFGPVLGVQEFDCKFWNIEYIIYVV